MNSFYKHTFLHAGEFQYFRIPVELWDKNIPKLKEIGINTISTYIPWNWHEIEESKFDFQGKTHPMRNLLHFLDLVREHNYNVIIRPGPYIYAEYMDFGIPEWFKEKYPETLIVTEKNKRLNNVSYGHPILMKYVKKWYSALYSVIKEYLEDGTIIAFQIDNETGLFQAGDVLEKIDYNDHIIDAYRKWLEQKFKKIERVNLLFKTAYSDFGSVVPPRGNIKKTNAGKWVPWLRFYQDFIIKYLEDLKKIAIKIGYNVPIILNDSIILIHPVSTKNKFRIGSVGLDIYVKVFEEFDTIFDYPFTSVFDSKYIDYYSRKHGYSSWGAEVQSGWLNPYVSVSNEQTWMLALSLMSHGLTGISWYIIHDAKEIDGSPYTYDSPFDIEGNETKRFEIHKRIYDLIDAYKDILVGSEEIFDNIAFAHTEANNIKHLQFVGDILIEAIPQKALLGAIADNQWNYRFLDINDESVDDLLKNKVLIFHSLGFASPSIVEKLEEYVHAGGRLITFPVPIVWDEYLHSLSSEIYPFILNKIEWPSINLFLIRFYFWTKKWNKIKKKYPHRWSEHTLYANYIASKIVNLGIKYKKTFQLGKIKVNGFLKHSQFTPSRKAPTIRRIMHHYGLPYGFDVKYGDGHSISIGTELFMHYNFPYYYSLTPEDHNNIRSALNYLLADLPRTVNISTKSTANIEVVLRRKNNDFLLFLFNRGAEKEVSLKFNIDPLSSTEYKVSSVFSLKTLFHSSKVKSGKFSVKISENDAVVFLLTQ